MSAEGNKAIVKKFIDESMSKGNADVVDEVISPNIVHRFNGGTKSFEEYSTMFKGFAGQPGPGPSIDEIIGEGEKVAIWFTGREGQHGSWIFRLSGGKIVESWNMTSFIRPE